MKQFLKSALTVVLIVIACAIIGYLFIPTATSYLKNDRAVGGDYYNGLTYLTFLAKELPWPPAGWTHIWNEGMPVIGGYPLTAFYLMIPLLRWFDTATAMEVFSIGSLLVFLVASLLLFNQVAKNVVIAFVLTLVVYLTPATYFQLFTDGLIAANSMQWLLPLTLFFAFRYIEKKSPQELALAILFSGISLIFHPAIGALTVSLPVFCTLFLYLLSERNLKRIITTSFIFITLGALVGISTIYPVINQMSKGAISGVCQYPACWGKYPADLIKWFTPSSLVILILAGILAIAVKVLGKNKFSLRLAISALGGMSFLLLYSGAAYLHLINTLASALFPRRLFWAINLFLLVFAAGTVGSIIVRLSQRVKWGLSIVGAALLVGLFFLRPQFFTFLPAPYFNRPGTIPEYIDLLTIPKYKTRTISETMVDWVQNLGHQESNYRFDSANQQLNHWWNTYFTMPNTRGYSNSPSGDAADWLYFFQTVTRDAKEKDERLLTNRALFMLDAYGIKLLDNGITSWPKTITDSSEIVARKDLFVPGSPYLRDSQWYEIADKYATPVVAPVINPAILVLGDKPGYNDLMRIFANENINSRNGVPVKGPLSISTLPKISPSLVLLYEFQDTNWDAIMNFVKTGGNLFMDTGTIPLKETYPDIFPAAKLKADEVLGPWAKQPISSSPYLQDIDVTQFAPLAFDNERWKIQYVETSDLKENVVPLLYWQDKVVLTIQTVGKGTVVWSGINLPYHIVNTGNAAESKLFGAIISSLLPPPPSAPAAARVSRISSNHISVSGNDFTGVYLKENYHPGWKAWVNGKSIPVEMAGLDMMYVSMPKDFIGKEMQVELKFTGTLLTWGLFFTSLIGGLLICLFIVIPQPFYWIQKRLYRLTGKVERNWNEDEE